MSEPPAPPYRSGDLDAHETELEVFREELGIDLSGSLHLLHPRRNLASANSATASRNMISSSESTDSGAGTVLVAMRARVHSLRTPARRPANRYKLLPRRSSGDALAAPDGPLMRRGCR